MFWPTQRLLLVLFCSATHGPKFDLAERNFSFKIAPILSHKFFWVKFSGEITLTRMGRAHREFTTHQDYEPGMDELLDLRDCSLDNLTTEDFEMIREQLSNQPDRHHTRSVIVVSSALQFGLSRMLGAILDTDVPVDRGISYSIEEALDWLHPGQADELLTIGREFFD